MKQPLVNLDKVDVALDGVTVLHGITWRLLPGEHWAVLGGNGSGKSTLLKLIRGELWPAPGSVGGRTYVLAGQKLTTAAGIKEQMPLVSPELQARYLQQEWKLTGLQVVHSGFDGGDYVYRRLTAAELKRARRVAKLLEIEPLLPRDVQTLSTGELRKVLIARALVNSPPALVCDEICDGLDAPSRASLLAALERVARNGTQLLYTTHRNDEILSAITHRLVLKAGRIIDRRKLSARERGNGIAKSTFREHPLAGRVADPRPGKREPAGVNRLNGERVSAPLIQIESADVFLERRRVLRNVNWSIRPGEHWAIVGANGAGKSTLLKLIAGDLHPALGGRVKRFSFTAKNTLWELRRRIGFVSPEFQAGYREAITGADVIASGFFSSVGLMRKPSAAIRRQVEQLVARLGLESLARRQALRMSYGEFRRILLARALVHAPRLLIFDEPFDGLDASARREMAAVLWKTAHQGVSLIVVTHHAADLPACITHVAELRAGRIIAQGPSDRSARSRPMPLRE